MSQPRFFTEEELAPGREIALRPDDAHHARRVLRLKVGDSIVIVRHGIAWDATLIRADALGVHACIDAARVEQSGELPAAVTILQALTKGAKFDEVVEKTVELGARRIIPVYCELSYARADAHKLERWQRIARAAAMQSRRRYLPTIETPLAWSDALLLVRGASLLVAYENAERGSLDEALTTLRNVRSLALAVGPEGGLNDTEVDEARKVGAALVSLGPTIVRTETAATALLAACASRLGWW